MVFRSKHNFLIQLEDGVHRKVIICKALKAALKKKNPFPFQSVRWMDQKGYWIHHLGCMCLVLMEHETHLGPICWEIQMKVPFLDVSFSQTPKCDGT